MCRDKKLVIQREKRYRLIEFQNNLVKSPYFRDTSMINVTSNGDPFASGVFWHLFKTLKSEDFPNLQMRVRTHGLGLSQRNWERMGSVRNMMKQIWISIDAATEPTYDIIRRGGNFKKLVENLEFLRSIKEEYKFSLALHFIVQKENYHEIPAFIEFSRNYNADIIWFAKVYRGPDMSQQQWEESAVHRPEHPLHSNFLEVMRHPNVLDPHIDWTNMKEFVNTPADGSRMSAMSHVFRVVTRFNQASQ